LCFGIVCTHESTRKLAGHVERGTGRIRSATVARRGGRWFVSFAVEVTRAAAAPARPDSVVGVDLGVTALAVLSTGEVAPNPRHLAGTGMAEFGRQIQYKTAWTGGRVHIADRWFPVRRRVRPVAW
jgi:transposase